MASRRPAARGAAAIANCGCSGPSPLIRPPLNFTLAYIIVGLLLVFMALAGTRLKRLPLTTSLLYLLAGIGMGPWGLGLIRVDPVESSALLERATEFAVIVSLFTAGLKLRAPLSDRDTWRPPLRLAFVSMALTVGLIAAAGVLLLGLPIGPAVLLGAVLAPTDPVLASDVQVTDASDRDRVRFSLTGEAGLNDGTAFPFVMLVLGLCGLHELGHFGWRWAAVDVLWAIVGGLAIGALGGTLIGRLVVHLRRTRKEAVGLDEFLSLGLLALSYGLAIQLKAYGFLAAFAAGVALRRIESNESGGADRPPEDVSHAAASTAEAEEEIDTHPDKAPAYMAQAVLGFNEQLERICEVALVLLLGAMLTAAYLPADALWFAPLLFLGIRPLAVYAGLLGCGLTGIRRGLVAWFGVRGVGSVYYLMFALQHGVSGDDAHRLTGLTLTVVAISIAVHGVSVTPLMSIYGRVTGRGREANRPAAGAATPHPR